MKSQGGYFITYPINLTLFNLQMAVFGQHKVAVAYGPQIS